MDGSDGGRPATVPAGALRAVSNVRSSAPSDVADSSIPLERFEAAMRSIAGWPGYRQTPLVALPGLARDLGISDLWYKNEGERFGVGSFKPMGGAYAVARLLERLASGNAAEPVRHTTSRITVACATDGNHGRAVAWGARLWGCDARVYVAAHVTAARVSAIAGFGAAVTRTSGNHDDAVRMVAADAASNGWYVISETGLASDPQIAWDVMTGYGAIMCEIVEQLGDARPSHVFVQAGVGGLAAAVTSYCRQRWGTAGPRIVVVEAASADCVLRSIEAGSRVAAPGPMNTVMAGLAAGEVSEFAWPILRDGVEACVAIPDETAIATLRVLANPPFGDPPVRAGESGVAGLAAALAIAGDRQLRQRFGLTADSCVLTIGTEGVTDRSVYERLLGTP